jgi:hypothetical protein
MVRAMSASVERRPKAMRMMSGTLVLTDSMRPLDRPCSIDARIAAGLPLVAWRHRFKEMGDGQVSEVTPLARQCQGRDPGSQPHCGRARGCTIYRGSAENLLGTEGIPGGCPHVLLSGAIRVVGILCPEDPAQERSRRTVIRTTDRSSRDLILMNTDDGAVGILQQ